MATVLATVLALSLGLLALCLGPRGVYLEAPPGGHGVAFFLHITPKIFLIEIPTHLAYTIPPAVIHRYVSPLCS